MMSLKLRSGFGFSLKLIVIAVFLNPFSQLVANQPHPAGYEEGYYWSWANHGHYVAYGPEAVCDIIDYNKQRIDFTIHGDAAICHICIYNTTLSNGSCVNNYGIPHLKYERKYVINKYPCGDLKGVDECDSPLPPYVEPNVPPVHPLTKEDRLNGEASCTGEPTAGNPITIANGNKYQQEWLLDPRFSLPLTLSYNSSDQQWRHSWQYQFGLSDDTGNQASLIRPDGKGFAFTKTNEIWSTFSDLNYIVEAFDDDVGSAWKVITPSGTTEIYNDQAQLLSLTTLQNQQYTLSHTDSTTEITGPFGDKLLLEFNDSKQLTQVSLNGAVQSTLVWDNEGRLQSRTDAQNQTISYHYEDSNFPNHLTGITGADGQRFATWAYDSEGRGILSEHAGEERATLQFNDDGTTTVTNSLGKPTTYHFTEIEGVKRPTQVEGHATVHCVGANQNYSYDALGRLQSKTDWQGRETRYEYNDRHLVTRIVEAANTPEERITDQQWHGSLPLLLERAQQGRTIDYTYGSNYRLITQSGR